MAGKVGKPPLDPNSQFLSAVRANSPQMPLRARVHYQPPIVPLRAAIVHPRVQCIKPVTTRPKPATSAPVRSKSLDTGLDDEEEEAMHPLQKDEAGSDEKILKNSTESLPNLLDSPDDDEKPDPDYKKDKENQPGTAETVLPNAKESDSDQIQQSNQLLVPEPETISTAATLPRSQTAVKKKKKTPNFMDRCVNRVMTKLKL
jgi:hypothetical protein